MMPAMLKTAVAIPRRTGMMRNQSVRRSSSSMPLTRFGPVTSVFAALTTCAAESMSSS
ncbi:Uncharacterised protein [Mycobacteroides abscessus subsp. abscessus]|nr:Uncharacterised protein [Mycobacteroides abscessus subsp. abscessus]